MHSSGKLSFVRSHSGQNNFLKSLFNRIQFLRIETIWGNFKHCVLSFVYSCFVMSRTFSMKLQIRPPSEFLCKNTTKRGAHIWLGPHYPFISVICRMGFLGLWLQLWRIIGTCSTQSPSFGLFLPCTSTNSPDKFHFFFATLSSLFFWYIWQVSSFDKNSLLWKLFYG